jgi:hypothetical protein
MARLLPSLPMYMHHLSSSSTPAVTIFFLLIAIFSVFSIITFFCSSSKVKKSLGLKEETIFRSNEKRLVSKINSNISSRALSMVKMISWRKAQAEGEEEEDNDDYSDEAVWRKRIMLGERCRPLDFSGKIVYDSQGNLLAD